jgi:hypothetical protein
MKTDFVSPIDVMYAKTPRISGLLQNLNRCGTAVALAPSPLHAADAGRRSGARGHKRDHPRRPANSAGTQNRPMRHWRRCTNLVQATFGDGLATATARKVPSTANAPSRAKPAAVGEHEQRDVVIGEVAAERPVKTASTRWMRSERKSASDPTRPDPAAAGPSRCQDPAKQATEYVKPAGYLGRWSLASPAWRAYRGREE